MTAPQTKPALRSALLAVLTLLVLGAVMVPLLQRARRWAGGESRPAGSPGAAGLAGPRSAVAPWASTPSNTPDPGLGYIPAWRIHPPRPETVRLPPVGLSPRDPQVTPMEALNPGGVDGQRPPREGPSLVE